LGFVQRTNGRSMAIRRGLPARIIVISLIVIVFAGTTFAAHASLAEVAVSLPALTASQGVDITVPITVDDLTGLGVIAYDIQVTFNPAVLIPAAQPVDTAGTLSSGMAVNPNTNNPGHMIIPAFLIGSPLAGAGTLLNLKFTVVGTFLQTTTLAFENYSDANNVLHPACAFNEGDPRSMTTDGSVTVANSAVSGTITYRNATGSPAQRFVSNVTLTALGSPNPNITTTTHPPGTTAGRYWLSGFGLGPYIITPSKTGEWNSAINSFDAAQISRHVANIPPRLTDTQLIVADVSGNGVVSSFDAAQLSAWVVHVPIGGSAGVWKFIPAARAYPFIETDIPGEDYSALLMGEVSGNWMNTGAARSVTTPSGSRSGGSETNIIVTAPKLTMTAHNEVLVPVATHGVGAKDIIAYQFDLRYDPGVLQPQSDPVDLAGTVSSALKAVVNAEEPGLLRVAVYGPMPIVGDGVLFNLRFVAVGKPGSVSPLSLERIIFNEGRSRVSVADGEVLIF
jgi:Cohesin domain/Dockerin type I domain